MLSRVNFRNEERFYTNIGVSINFDNRRLDGFTSDISEGGMSIIIDSPEYIPYDKNVGIKVKYSNYESNIMVKVVHVMQLGNKWKYSMKIEEISASDKNEYYQIVYDRDHTLAKNMKSNTLKEIKVNTVNRNKPQVLSNRKLPRISLNQNVSTMCGKIIQIVNFNYEYILIKGTISDENINLKLSDDIVLSCEKCNGNNVEGNTLYRIDSWEEVLNNEAFREVLMDLVNGNRKDNAVSLSEA